MNYVRNGQSALKILKERSDSSVITLEKCSIQVPVRFTDVGLATIGASVFIFGLFPIITESGDYGVLSANALFELGQFTTAIISVGEVDYYEFTFEPGSVIFKTAEVVQNTSILFSWLNEIYFMGKVPWYASYKDICFLPNTAKEFTGTRAEIISGVGEFMAAYIAREKRDKTKFVRQTAKTMKDLETNLAWVPMKSVFLSAPGTVNKISGAYTENGIVAALVNPSESVHRVESVLRA